MKRIKDPPSLPKPNDETRHAHRTPVRDTMNTDTNKIGCAAVPTVRSPHAQ